MHLIPVPLERVRNAVHTFKQLSQQHGIQFAELSVLLSRIYCLSCFIYVSLPVGRGV